MSEVKLLQEFFPRYKSAEMREIEIVVKEEVV